ncbi:Protein phosphatase PP2A regulatory subunit B [Orbilia brochopaga]|uniref:aminodeoxychorismate synthase n=1 Tax=Orbilia brochopaga TaxID=3140254 RepID=A0AAV9UPW1_9PEZI
MAPARRILLLDAYDSFSNNLAALIRLITHAQVYTIKIDTYTFAEFRPFLKSFDAIVIGPGPGSPSTPADVGIIPDIYALAEADAVPVFGVCLGFQSLCLAFGGRIERLKVVKHGQSSVIRHTGTDIFENSGTVDAIRYHSLHAVLDEAAEKHLDVLAMADDGADENGEVLMAVRHRTLPFWGVQYHPESCCTNAGGASAVGNWWRLATRWLEQRGLVNEALPDSWRVPLRQTSLLGLAQDLKPQSWPVQCNSFRAPCLSIVQLCEMLDVATQETFAMLDSSAKHTGRYTMIGVFVDSVTETITYRVGSPTATVTIAGGDEPREIVDEQTVENGGGGIWEMVSRYMDANRAEGGDEECPFWGGFIGYFNYEVGVAGLGVQLRHPRAGDGETERPDVNLTFFHRSIVVDNVSGKVWVQSILCEDEEWVARMTEKVQVLAAMSITPTTTPPNGPRNAAAANASRAVEVRSVFPAETVTVIRPDKEMYMENVRQCQRELARGESYELCLTAQTTIDVLLPNDDAGVNPTGSEKTEDTAWRIYRQLRTRNPAPFAGFYKVAGMTLLSSSPERFLSWDRRGRFQLRPIKGTVRKAQPDGSIVTRREAEAVLNTPKERAENLMIVDLIRHDLHGVLDGQEDDNSAGATKVADGVTVTKLMGIEEYETVFQLVSVIEGRMGARMSRDGFTGMDVLSRCLPPGSMTGAPKKRSVEILQEIESRADETGGMGERGVYSGVLGYWSACGAGDWSVVIRSMWRTDELGDGGRERWRIGAGGAVTALSDPEGEWDEMVIKLDSTLAAFL